MLKHATSSVIGNLRANHLKTIIDAYGFTEYELDSALARSDVEPYEALFEEGAKRSEMSGSGMSHLWPSKYSLLTVLICAIIADQLMFCVSDGRDAPDLEGD